MWWPPVLMAAALLAAPGATAGRARLVGTLPVAAAGGAAGDAAGGAAPDRSQPARPAGWLPWAAGLAAAALAARLIGGVGGLLVGGLVGVGAVAGCRRVQHGATTAPADPMVLAGAWEQLGACLRAGLPVPVAVRAVGVGVPGAAGAALRRVAELLALGADPVQAWEPALADPATARFARAARQSARSGAAIAELATAAAAEVRLRAADLVAGRAQRAGVLIAGPLGLCFLPAFLAVGVLPVVIGLAGPLLARW